MNRWLPYPLLALALLAMWLLLTQSLSPGQIVLGGGIAVLATHAMAALKPEKARIRSYRPIPRLFVTVSGDIIRSNIAVARIVLGRSQRKRVSGFVRVPLDMQNRYGLTILACIITATPGTAWARYDSTRSVLIMHILDLVDEETWIHTIKGRYERRLLEIFQ